MNNPPYLYEEHMHMPIYSSYEDEHPTTAPPCTVTARLIQRELERRRNCERPTGDDQRIGRLSRFTRFCVQWLAVIAVGGFFFFLAWLSLMLAFLCWPGSN